jgi:DNA-binding response OmpR family regulator
MAHPHSDQLLAGPQLPGSSLQHNDCRHLLVVQGRIVPLTRTEYGLTMLLLRRVEQVQASASAGRMNFFVPVGDLLQAVPVTRETLRQHVRNANVKLAPHGIALASVGTYGYTAVFVGGQEDQVQSQQALARS